MEGNISANYVKAIDPNGIYVYVNLDAASFNMTVSHSDLQNQLVQQATTTISASARNAVASGGSPAMIVSGSSLCAIKQCNDGTCEEKFYTACTNGKVPKIENGVESNVPIRYPIVSIRQIMQSAENTTASNKVFYETEMERIFKETQEKLNSTLQACKYLDFAACSFNTNRDLAFTALKNDRKIIGKAIKESKESKSDKEVHICNMTKRNELYEDYIKTTHEFTKVEQFIMKLTKEMTELNNKIVDAHVANFGENRC